MRKSKADILESIEQELSSINDHIGTLEWLIDDLKEMLDEDNESAQERQRQEWLLKKRYGKSRPQKISDYFQTETEKGN